jgi:hypothetical protein
MKHIRRPFLPFVIKLAEVKSLFSALLRMFNGQMFRAPKVLAASLLSIYYIFKNEGQNKDWFN